MTSSVRAAHPEKFIPDFDPADGGITAKVLVLLEAPGPKATQYVSRDNPDPTARNIKSALEAAGVPRADTCLWNVVPFYIGRDDRTCIRAAKQSDISIGAPFVLRLIDAMPNIRSVVLLGRKAQRVAAHRPDLKVLQSWHPSGQSLNPVPARRKELVDALRMATLC